MNICGCKASSPFFVVMCGRLFLILSAVILIHFSLPSGLIRWFPFLIMVPFALALRGLKPASGFLWGWFYGASIWLVSTWWVTCGLENMLLWPVSGAWALTGLFCLFQGLPYALFGAVHGWVEQTGRCPGVIFSASLLMLLVYLRPLVCPGSPAVSLYAWPMAIQTADIGGVSMVFFFMLLANWLNADIIIHLRRPRLAAARLATLAALLTLILGYGAWRLDHYHTLARFAPPNEFISVTAVQPNLPVKGYEGIDDSGPYAGTIGTMVKITERSANDFPDTDLIVLPEVPPPMDCNCDDFDLQGVTQAASAAGAPILAACVENDYGRNPPITTTRKSRDGFDISVTSRKIETMYNAAWVIAPEKCGKVYRKVKLVPFSERTPFQSNWPWLKQTIGRKLEYSPGIGPELVTIESGRRIQSLICFESGFPDLVRKGVGMGADLLVNISDDAWFETANASELHLGTALFRAVEMRRPLVCCTNSGFGAHIAPTGEIIPGSLTSVNVRTYRQARLHCPEKHTLYFHIGDAWLWLPGIFVLIELIRTMFFRQSSTYS